jgi:hypothetical protein
MERKPPCQKWSKLLAFVNSMACSQPHLPALRFFASFAAAAAVVVVVVRPHHTDAWRGRPI